MFEKQPGRPFPVDTSRVYPVRTAVGIAAAAGAGLAPGDALAAPAAYLRVRTVCVISCGYYGGCACWLFLGTVVLSFFSVSKGFV